MIPLKDDNPTKTFAFVTLTFVIANVLVFLHQLQVAHAGALEPFLLAHALVPAQVTQPVDLGAYRTIVSSMFLHGGWLHLIGNMLFLWIFGNNIEDSVGHARFVVFYLLCGTAAAGAQIAINPASTIPMVGASGAVSGVLGAYLLLFPRARVLVAFPIWIFIKLFYVPAVVLLVVWFALQLLGGWALADSDKGGVAFWAHIGGFVAGLGLIPLFKKRGVRLFR